MRLLVSVRNASEASRPLPAAPTSSTPRSRSTARSEPFHPTFSTRSSPLSGTRRQSARRSERFRRRRPGPRGRRASAGVAFVKVGFAGMRRRQRFEEDVVALARAAHPSALVLVVYADFDVADAPPPAEILALAAHLKPAGILLDTYDKNGAGLTSLMPACTLATFVSRAKASGRFVAIAGKLTLEDIETMHDIGPDVIGLRGAACDGGRDGIVTSSSRPCAVRSHERDTTCLLSGSCLKGGCVLTLDPDIGNYRTADVLIEGSKITSVGPRLKVADAEVIDCSDMIVMPGFIDTHRHIWEGILKNIAPDALLDEYFRDILGVLAPVYRPQDAYAGNLVSALGAIDAGVTTLLDWSHIQNTPEHTDAAISRAAGVGPAFDLRLRHAESRHARLVAQQQPEASGRCEAGGEAVLLVAAISC